MPKKRKFTSVDDKCRVCLGDDGCMSDIFSEDIKPKIYALGESTSTHIYNDENLPRNICHVCLYKLDMWIEFKRQFLRSHEMLREHLGLAELVDNAASAAKRKHVEKSAKEDSPDVGAAKKMKLGELAGTDAADAKCKGDEKSQAEGEIVSPDTLAKNISDNAELAEGQETSENATRAMRGASPTKQTSGRRGKTTERREASTKRWVARKRALLAATGENETDTDSETSDEAQLSPVRKARAKSNADKVAESQRRVAKSLRTFEDNDRQGSKDGDEDKEDGGSEVDEDSRDAKTIEKRKKEVEPDAARLEGARKTAAPNDIKDSTAALQTVSKNFLPHSIRSELTIDEATFIVTSTLVLQEPHHLSPVSLPQLPKENAEPVVPSTEDANQEQRNTDIIDAVQLRRVPPKSPAPSSDRKYLERCLNIEVEGTELEALQRVQSDLAVFVETKLLQALDVGTSSKPDDEAKNPSQSLDQQLKTIVEKSIKRNLENTRIERASACENRGNNTFTGDFVKAAMRSRIFQPRVLLVRYEDRAIKENSQVNEPKLGKRRSIIPAKFADYDGSPFNTASDEPKETTTRKTDPPSSKLKAKVQPAKIREAEPQTQANSTEPPKRDPPSVSVDKNQSLDKSVQPDEKSASPTMSAPPLTNSVIAEKHICGVCGESFGTRREVEIHFSAHKVAPPVVTIRQVKPKMMRCKRCHEIVEAGYVRLHVCNTPRNNKCRVCEATFRSEKLLAKHLETHGDEEKASEIEPSAPTAEVPNVEPSSALVPTSDTTPKKRPVRDASGPPSNNDTYTCFVCDKIFEGEQVLKDHLQKHCDDISEEEDEDDEDEDDDDDDDDDDDEVARDEPSVNDKELYQCAICGESMQSEDALESHVEKHLFDDEDDNPNLISIVERQDERTMRNKERNVHGCDQCDETFDSEMLLMLHVQAHEEEVAIAEWERRGVDGTREEQHTCVICDEVFATEAELSEHLDVHNGNAHVCQLCDKPFLTLEELRAHVDTH